MYLYLYDSFLQDKKYHNFLARIETRLTDLGISGKIFRLSPLRNIKELLEDDIRGGAKTVVVVGDDATLSNVINLIPRQNVILGYIPVGPNTTIAQALGIPVGEPACAVLAARIIEPLDLGKINTNYFISSVTVTDPHVTIECEQQFTITPEPGKSTIAAYNFQPGLKNLGNYGNPQDGLLELYIESTAPSVFGLFKKSKPTGPTIIPFRHIEIKSKSSVSIVSDGQRVFKTPVKIDIVPQACTMIVGKQRAF